MDKVIADLYFTLPFDLGIIDAKYKFNSTGGPLKGKTEQFGKIIAGEPYEIDKEASLMDKLNTGYLQLIENGKLDLESAS